MDLKNNQITVKELLTNEKARRLIKRELPMALNSQYIMLVRNTTLAQIIEFSKGRFPKAKINRLLEELKKL